MNYALQIKHPLWQKKRLEVLEYRGFTCQECQSQNEELHVHHPVYKRGALIWEYTKDELECLCHVCHKNAHALDEQIKKMVALLNSESKKQVVVYIQNLNTTATKNKKRARRWAVTPQWMKPHCNLSDLPVEQQGMSQEEFFAKMKTLLGGDCV